MKTFKFLSFAIALLFASPAIAQNVVCNMPQGGASFEADSGCTVNVNSGGAIEVESGGSLDVKSGGSLLIGSVTMSATASELNQMDDSNLATDGGGLKKRVVRSTFDTQVDGGAIGAYDLGEDLPANAIVVQAWFQIITQFTDGGSGTVALSCAGANDLFSAADITGSAGGTITSGVPDGTAANMFDVGGSACNITATVAAAEQTAGKLVLWVEYVVSE